MNTTHALTQSPLNHIMAEKLKGDETRFNVEMRKSLHAQLLSYSQRRNVAMSVIAREALENAVKGYLPVLGTIPCGEMAEALEASEKQFVVPAVMEPDANRGDFLLEASGDSMAPRIMSGDLVLLRPNIEPSDGDICAVQLIDEQGGIYDATLKKIVFEDKRKTIALTPINPDFDVVRLPAERVRIVGVFKGLINRGR